MRRLSLILSVAGLAALSTACISVKSETGDTWETEGDADADSDADSDSDSDSDSDADADVPHDYKSYSGQEVWSYQGWKDSVDLDCTITWDAVGTYRDACADCEFAFDVALTYNAGSSFDNTAGGDCAGYMTDFSFGYGYTDDYQGYGSYVMYYSSTYGWGAWTAGTFDGSNFEYSSGYSEYYYSGSYGYYPDYAGKYITNYYEGYATVSK
ncbi:MAG: hypothetical protein VX899_10915 [Myxococcota bacterium]|nr:hypothetical protein [Myxococcota bacterium]